MSFKSLVENSPDVISLVSVAGEVLYASTSTTDVFGYSPDELVGRNMFDLIHLEDRERLRQAFQDVVERSAGPVRADARVYRKDSQWSSVESTVSNLLGEHRVDAMVVSYREISVQSAPTDRGAQQIDREFRPDTDFDDFASAVAHDLREPLRTISTYTDLLLREVQFNEQVGTLSRFILDGVAGMTALLDGLQSMAVPGLKDLPRSFDLGPVVSDVLRNISYAITESDALVIVDPMPWVEANQNHMMIVFQNLIINAIKYSTAPIQIHISAEVLGPRLIVKVADNGIGIPQKYQQCIFEPLKRLHGSEIPGAGIGLAVCKKIVEAAGGRIWVNSSPGAGSTFCFTVAPAASQCAASSVPRINASAEFRRAQTIDGNGSKQPLLLRAGAANR